MPHKLVKHLTLDAENLTFYVFNPKLTLAERLETIVRMVASTTNEDCKRGYVAIDNAIAYYIEPDPIEYDLDIYFERLAT